MAKKKMPAWYEENYPEWKRILWGALRAFVASFLPVFGFLLTNVTIENFQDRETLIKLAVSIGLSSVVAGIVGLGKYLRNIFPESEIVQKVPF